MTGAMREFVEAIVLALVVFFVIQLSIQNFKVEGSSMDPTLHEGQFLLVNKVVYAQLDMERLSRLIPFWDADEEGKRYLFHPPKRGEVIVFRFPLDTSRDFVKRVIAVPGETIEIRAGVVYINGRVLNEPYLRPGAMSREFMAPRTMGEGQYFVMGDNRRASNDSRDWGPVAEEYIIGKVWLTYWPPDRLGFVNTMVWFESLLSPIR